MLAGWGLPAIITAVALPLTGVSYRFGNTCHINHERALQDYWGPLLAFAILSTILQFTTLLYCIKVYLKSLFADSTTNSTSQMSSSNLPSYSSKAGSVKTVTAGQAYRRVKKVIALQWRGTVVVLIIIINVVFLAVVFVQMDNTVTAALQDLSRAEPWLLCLVLNQGNKNACLDKVEQAHLVTSGTTVMAVLIILSLNGIWTLFFFGRSSILKGWLDLIRSPFSAKNDFVSVDARRFSAMSGAPSSSKHYEMITSPNTRPPSLPASLASTMPLKPEFAVLGSPAIDHESRSREGLSPLPQSPVSATSEYRDSDYFGKDAEVAQSSTFGNKDAEYRSPKLSFSTPRPPSAGRTQSFSRPISRPYSRESQQRNFSPHAGTTPRTFSPGLAPAQEGNQNASRSITPSIAIDWDPSATYARPSTATPDRNTRMDGFGKILKKDEDF